MKLKLVVFTLVLAFITATGCSSPTATPTPSPVPPTSSPTSLPTAIPTPTDVTVIEGRWVADGVISSAEYTNSKTFGDYEIHWTNDIDYIFVAMRCKTSGWVAVGFKPERRMKNADMVYGFVEQGKVSIFDMFSTSDFGPHPPDVEQGGSDDILEFAGAEENGFTTIEFKRSLDTGDSKDQILTSGGNAILWAYGSGDSTTQRHARRGTDQIELK